jgi:hypothetical protein
LKTWSAPSAAVTLPETCRAVFGASQLIYASRSRTGCRRRRDPREEDDMGLVIGLILFALMLIGIFFWLGRSQVSDPNKYDTPLADSKRDLADRND